MALSRSLSFLSYSRSRTHCSLFNSLRVQRTILSGVGRVTNDTRLAWLAMRYFSSNNSLLAPIFFGKLKVPLSANYSFGLRSSNIVGWPTFFSSGVSTATRPTPSTPKSWRRRTISFSIVFLLVRSDAKSCLPLAGRPRLFSWLLALGLVTTFQGTPIKASSQWFRFPNPLDILAGVERTEL